MGSAEDPQRRAEIQSSLSSIVESSDRWLGRLKRRESRVRLASSFLTTVLVFVAVAAAVLIFTVAQNGWPYLVILFHDHPGVVASYAGTALLVGLICGFATYFLLKRRHDARLKELASLIAEMKQANGQGITEHALSSVEKIMTLLPELVRKRNQDSLLFGVVAFVLASIIGSNPGIGILIGVIVWLYFRYEFTKTYEQAILRLEEQKRVFEQRKKDFVETL
jgi:uncharacterized membrane-anchored protein YhcB (DUF1043 family)